MATSFGAGRVLGRGLVWHGRTPYNPPRPGQLISGGESCEAMRIESWTGAKTAGVIRVISRRVPDGYTWFVTELDGSHRGDDNNGFNLAAFIVPPRIAAFANPSGGDAGAVPLEANTNVPNAFVGPLEGVFINQGTINTTPTAQGGRVLTFLNPRDVVIVPSGHALFAMIIESAGIGIGTNALRLRALLSEVRG